MNYQTAAYFTIGRRLLAQSLGLAELVGKNDTGKVDLLLWKPGTEDLIELGDDLRQLHLILLLHSPTAWSHARNGDTFPLPQIELLGAEVAEVMVAVMVIVRTN